MFTAHRYSYEEEGYFENDHKEGEWKRFSLEGVKIAQENYRWGKLSGKQQYFTYNGGLTREEISKCGTGIPGIFLNL